jgi:phosphoserine phosphatase
MQQLNYPISINQLYQVEANNWLKADDFDCKLSKLSLFCDEGWSPQWQTIQQVFKLVEGGFLFCCQQSNLAAAQSQPHRFHWNLYADYEKLQQLTAAIAELKFDFLLWPEKTHQPPQLLLFDMDSTFIQIEVIDELAKRHGVGNKVSELTEKAMQGELDFEQSLVQRVQCLAGLDVATIDSIASSLPLSSGIKELVESAHKNKTKVVIASGGFIPFAQKLKADLNLFAIKANELASTNGCLTGTVSGKIVDAQAKADFLVALCIELSLEKNQVMAIGDGANDLLMMKQAGFNLAYYAKPKVEQQACGRLKQSQFNRLIDVFNWD